MRKRSDIHVFEDEAFLRTTARAARVALVAGALLALVLAVALLLGLPGALDEGLARLLLPGEGRSGGGLLVAAFGWLLWLVMATLVALITHELIHGLFFKLFAPAGTPVRFGANWSHGMLFACTEGVVYSRRRYLATVLAPTFVVTASVLVAGFASGHAVGGVLVAAFHLSGCAGDWGYAAVILADPRITHCEDTSYGVCFYEAGEGTGSEVEACAGADAHAPAHATAGGRELS